MIPQSMIVIGSPIAPPEPAMGIAIAWRKGDTLPTLERLREVAAAVAAHSAA